MKAFFRAYWGILSLIAAWSIFASPMLLKGLVPFPSNYLVSFFPPWSAAYGMPVKNNAMPDIISQIYPWKKVTVDSWRVGQVPLWNPYSFAGTPHAGNYQTAVFSPLNLLFFVFSSIDAWSVLILLQPLLAGLFMYAFVRSLGLQSSSAVLSALAFMFCGFMVVWMAYGTLVYAALWLPVILTGIHKQMQKRSWWNGVLVSVGVALSFLSGHFQISLYVLLCTCAYLLYLGVRHRRWKVMLGLFVFVCIGLFIAMPQLLVSLNAYADSVRSSSFIKGEIIPWQYLITMVAPDFFGNPVTRNDWFGHYAEWASYIGIVPLLLATFACFLHKKREEWFFVAAAVVSLALALPTPLSDLLFALRIPVLSTSAASRIIILTSFSLCVLAGYGFDGLQAESAANKKKIFRFIAFWLLGIIILWSVVSLGRILPSETLSIAKRNIILPTGMIVLGLVLLGVGVVAKKRAQAAITIAILVLTGIDVLRFAIKWMPFDPKEYIYPEMPITRALQEKVGINRVFGNYGNELSNFFGVPSIEGYDALYQERYGTFIASADNGQVGKAERSVVLLGKGSQFAETVLRLLGVKYYLHRLSDGRNVWAYPFWKYDSYISRYKDEHYEIMENTRALPRAFLASSYVVQRDDQKILDTLYSSDFDLADTLVLEEKPTIEPVVGPGDVSVVKYTPNEISLLVNTTGPKLLFLSDVFDEGWVATIDAKKTKIYRADYAFRAVSVPSGKHTVTFFYSPPYFFVGLFFAIVGLGVLVLGSSKELLYARRNI